MSRVAKNLQRFRIAVAAHDRENPDHQPAYGIGLTAFDANCLGFEDGEELWFGITLKVIENVTTGNFKVLCAGAEHDSQAEAREIGRAVA